MENKKKWIKSTRQSAWLQIMCIIWTEHSALLSWIQLKNNLSSNQNRNQKLSELKHMFDASLWHLKAFASCHFQNNEEKKHKRTADYQTNKKKSKNIFGIVINHCLLYQKKVCVCVWFVCLQKKENSVQKCINSPN